MYSYLLLISANNYLWPTFFSYSLAFCQVGTTLLNIYLTLLLIRKLRVPHILEFLTIWYSAKLAFQLLLLQKILKE